MEALKRRPVSGRSIPKERPAEETVRGIVMLHARGNVNLQFGNYWTESNKREMRDRVLKYKVRAKA